MSIVLNLPPELENELSAEATRLGLPLQDHVLRILASGRSVGVSPRTGPELVAYWKSEGLVGTRPDIGNSQDHARALRQTAERRTHT